MMKQTLFVLIASMFCISASHAESETHLSDDPGGPFYLMNHYEISRTKGKQKEDYLKKVKDLVSQIRPFRSQLTEIDLNGLEKLSLEEDTWENLNSAISIGCQVGQNRKICSALKETRLNAWGEPLR